ncbi:MAG TPA: hypothetical protein PKJ63_07390, partial [Cyclobacteriaceae bacterium]|nr:hypothetical protein [Cyclobacteriaceae bacterium]
SLLSYRMDKQQNNIRFLAEKKPSRTVRGFAKRSKRPFEVECSADLIRTLSVHSHFKYIH